MSAATSGAGEPGRLRRAAVRAGHHAERWEPLTTALLWTYVLLLWWLPGFADRAAVILFPAVILIAFGGFVLEAQHMRQLCPQCLDETPLLNPQAALDKHGAKLRAYHHRRWRTYTMVLALTPLIITLTMFGRDHLPLWARVALTLLTLPVLAASGLVAYIARIHRRLYPWCPWCRGGGGGHGDSTPAPTPDPAGSARR